jgi:phospholipid/cholesterol/gamma-HCH transport system substrate-binding protein
VIPRRVIVNLVAFVLLFVLLASWAVQNVVQLDQIERPYTIVAEFESSPGLQPNVEATYLGVSVGSIETVELADDHVRVEIDIDRGVEIPEGISAAVRRKSAVGEPYVALDPPADPEEAPAIDPGARYTIPLERTSIPLSYGQLFASVDDLVSSVPPEDFGIVLHELATALEGRGPKLREILAGADQLTGTLATRTDTFDELATSLTDLTHTLTSRREGIGSAFDDLTALTDSLARSSDDIRTLMEEAPAFGVQVRDLLEATYVDLSCAFDDVGSVFREVGTEEHIDGLVDVLRNAARARDALDAALVEPGQDGADGPYLGGSFGIVVDDPPAPYATPPTLPEPPALAVCAAPAAPGVDESSGAGASSAGGVGRRPERGLDVPGRVAPAAPDLPASSTADARSEAFPLAALVALAGIALLAALFVAVRPWRWLPLARGSDSPDA